MRLPTTLRIDGMDDQAYASLCEALFEQVEDILDGLDDDVDYESNGDICEVTTADGSKIVINRQPPVKEIWLAAKSGGYHFKHDGDRWVDTRGGTEFFARLESCLAGG